MSIILKFLGTKVVVATVTQVLLIAWAQVPHVGYWHGSGLEPKGSN